MRKQLLYLVLFFCLAQQLYSQEDGGVVAFNIPVRNSLKFNQQFINPTFSFVREQNKYISFNNKRQLVQFNDAPQTYLFGYSGRFQENIGAGLTLFQQDYGVLSTFGGVVNFAYNAVLNRDSNLTFGLNLGFYNSGLNQGRVLTNFPDAAISNVPSNSIVTINPGLNYGIEFLDFGVSLNNLVSYNLTSSKMLEDNPEQSIQGHIMYTGYINSRGFFDDSRFTGLVSTEFKQNETIVSVMAMLMVPKGIWFQAGYHSPYAFSGGIGMNISPQVAFEYNYEQSLKGHSSFGHSHDVTLAYRFISNNRYNYSGDDDEEGLLFGQNNKRRPAAKRKSSSRSKKRKKDITKASKSEKTKEEARLEAKKVKQAEAARVEAEKLAKANEREDTKIKAIEAEKAKQAEAARVEAEKIAKAKAIEDAKIKAIEAKKAKQAEAARVESEKIAKAKERENAKLKAIEAEKVKQAEAAQLESEKLAKAKAIEDAKLKAIEAEKVKQAEAAIIESEKLAKAKAIEDAKIKAIEAEKAKQAEATRIEAEKIAKAKEREDAKIKAIEAEKAKQAEAARVEAEKLAKAKAIEDVKLKAIDAEKAKQAEAARIEAEKLAKAKEREDAKIKAIEAEKAKQAEAARVESEKLAKAKAIEDAKLKAIEAEKAKQAEAARIEAEKLAKAKEREDAKLKAIEAEKAKQAEASRIESEKLAKAKAVEDAKLKAIEAEKAKQAEAARVEAEKIAKAKAVEDAKIKAIEAEKAKQAEAARVEAEKLAKAKAIEDAKIKAIEAEKGKQAEAARIEAEKLAKAKAIEDAKLKAIEAEKAKQAEAARIEAEKLAKAKAIEDAKIKAIEAEKAKQAEAARVESEKIAKAKAIEAAKVEAAELAAQKLKEIEAERLKIKQEKETKIEEVALDAVLIEFNKSSKLSKNKQQDLLDKLVEKVSIKQQDLSALKKENDLSEQGIISAPKAFKSVSAENAEIERLKLDIDNAIASRNAKLTEIETLYKARLKKVKSKDDPLNKEYLRAIEALKAEQGEAALVKQNLVSTLKTIKRATDFERNRRIKRAAYDNDNDRYLKDRAALARIKKFTTPSSESFTKDDFDNGETLSNIQIVKGINNVESGYYLVVAVHSSIEKRNDFLEKAVAAGAQNIDFFFDLLTSKYYIYLDQFNNLNAAKSALNSNVGSKPYNAKMSMVKIEN